MQYLLWAIKDPMRGFESCTFMCILPLLFLFKNTKLSFLNSNTFLFLRIPHVTTSPSLTTNNFFSHDFTFSTTASGPPPHMSQRHRISFFCAWSLKVKMKFKIWYFVFQNNKPRIFFFFIFNHYSRDIILEAISSLMEWSFQNID